MYFLQTILQYLLIFILSLLAIIYVYYKYALKYWNHLGMPYPEPSFPLGNMNKLVLKKMYTSLKEIYTDMKSKGHEYCGFYILGIPFFMPLSPKMISQCLIANFNHFQNRGFHVDENDPTSLSLLTSKGENWKKMSRKVSPVFSSGKVKVMFSSMLKVFEELEVIVDEAIKNGEPIDIRSVTTRSSFDILSSCLFSIDTNCLQNPNSDMFRYCKIVSLTTFLGIFRITIGVLAPIISKLLRINLIDPQFTSYTQKIVHELITYREQNNIELNDFLSVMIRLKNKKSAEAETDKNKCKEVDSETFTMDQIVAECITLLIGGYETIATTIHFALYEIAKNPAMQNKLREEIKETIKKFDNTFCYDAIKEMFYLENIAYETFRKYPPFHMLNRECTDDFTIPDTNITIKKGIKVIIPVFSIHRDPEFYPNPEVFDPNRFTAEAKATRPSYVYLPFGDGPRKCSGFHFALLEVKSCIAYLVLKYKFKVHPSFEEIELCSYGSMLIPTKPIKLTAARL